MRAPREAKLPPYQSLVDTGVTASAGGKQAAQDLCKSLIAVRPNLEVTVIETARPWLRFGSGRWGRALYKATLKDNMFPMSIYALPAVGVPVLTGTSSTVLLREHASFEVSPRSCKRTTKSTSSSTVGTHLSSHRQWHGWPTTHEAQCGVPYTSSLFPPRRNLLRGCAFRKSKSVLS